MLAARRIHDENARQSTGGRARVVRVRAGSVEPLIHVAAIRSLELRAVAFPVDPVACGGECML